MSQTDLLVNDISEPHIIINSDRFITVPSALKRIGVQHDHNIETVTFDCPSNWSGRNLAEMTIYINYLLPNSETGCCVAKNVVTDGDTMHFDWTLTREVTTYKGNLMFLVCAKKIDENGNEIHHWNSELCKDLYISEGLECTETILHEYPDIVTYLLTRMSAVEAAIPQVTSSDNGKFLRVVDGAWTAVTLTDASQEGG